MYSHLHVHSSFSFLEGLASPQELAHAAAEAGLPALALTDHTGMSGSIEFYDACREVGVQPILGLELDVGLPFDLVAANISSGVMVLLAMDLAGWRSLCRLSSAVLIEQTTSSGVLPFEHLVKEANGLICLSGGLRGLATRLIAEDQAQFAQDFLQNLMQVFPERLYVELQQHSKSDQILVRALYGIADRLNLPVVATHDIYYLKPEQSSLQRLVSAMRLNIPMNNLPEDASAPPEAYFQSLEEMEQRFTEYPQALEATQKIADRCQFELPLGVPIFPELQLPPGDTALSLLRRKAERGALQVYGQPQINFTNRNKNATSLRDDIRARLEHELSVIDDLGYASLFLIMEEILAFARQQGIQTSSRGSAASSLVAHCLGITTPDPVRLNLYFERFLNPARASPPDIDVDLCSRRRDEVIDYVYNRYGHERVAMVCTINRFRRRSALREVAKAHGLAPKEVDTLAASLPRRWYGPPERTGVKDEPFAELAERFPSAQHQTVFREARAMLGKPRHLSIHPGGVVIAPGELTDIVPLQQTTKGVVITQFDLDSVERTGLVKIDLLGIRGLSVLGDVAEQVTHPASKKTNHGAVALRFLETIPPDDARTALLLQEGRSIGCFQIESPGMRTTLKEIQPKNADDVMVALALYRPGPLIGGLKKAFIRRHRGVEPPVHLHSSLAPLLDDTYGVILYQEQVLRIAHELAGLSLADADLLRRGMSHFDPGKQMGTLKRKFIIGAYERNAVSEATAERIWELMAAFAGYGFPKAHAASYALISWRAAWCKVNHPALFMAAVLANWGGYYSQRVYLSEARRMGLDIQPPNVNYARRQFSAAINEDQLEDIEFPGMSKDATLFMGLDQVRELTRRTQTRILRMRPFQTFDDFLARVDPRPQEAKNLVFAGALTDFGTIPDLLSRLDQGGWSGGQLPLFTQDTTGRLDLSLAEKAAAQESVLGVSLVAHPLEVFAEQIGAYNTVNTLEAAARSGENMRLAGMRQYWRRSGARGGDFVYIMTLEDLEGVIEVVISSEVYRLHKKELSGSGPYIVEGTVELDQRFGEPFMRAERLWRVAD